MQEHVRLHCFRQLKVEFCQIYPLLNATRDYVVWTGLNKVVERMYHQQPKGRGGGSKSNTF